MYVCLRLRSHLQLFKSLIQDSLRTLHKSLLRVIHSLKVRTSFLPSAVSVSSQVQTASSSLLKARREEQYLDNYVTT
jgi:hypothetical protein